LRSCADCGDLAAPFAVRVGPQKFVHKCRVCFGLDKMDKEGVAA